MWGTCSLVVLEVIYHWRSSHYAVTHVPNKKRNIQVGSPNVVKVIIHTIIPSKHAYMGPIWATHMGSATGFRMGPIWVSSYAGCPDRSHMGPIKKQEMSQTHDECPQRNWSSIRHI